MVLRHMERLAFKRIAREAFENEEKKPFIKPSEHPQGDQTRIEENGQSPNGKNKRPGIDGSLQSISDEGKSWVTRQAI